MPGDTCVVCGNTRVKDPSVSMHRFPQDKTKRLRWLKALGLKDDYIGSHHRVCSRHFPEGDAKSYDPQLSLGKRFASPKKRWTGRLDSNYLARHSSGTVQARDFVLAATGTLEVV